MAGATFCNCAQGTVSFIMYIFVSDLKEQNDLTLFVTFSIISFGVVCRKYGSSKRMLFLYLMDFGYLGSVSRFIFSNILRIYSGRSR